MVSGREQFLAAQIEPGKANEPCRYAYIFPARIALSSEKIPPFQQAGFLGAAEHLPLKTVEPYSYTLRQLRVGYVYHIEKAGGKLNEVEFDDSGHTDKKPWFRIDTTIQELYIVFSGWKWDEAFQKKVVEAPEDHMQKVTLKAGQTYVGSAGQIGELVEEFRAEPGKLVSLRGFAEAKEVCDSEDIYAERETYAPKTQEDLRFLTRRWRDGGYKVLAWTPLEKGAIPEVPCPAAQAENRVFLLALQDSVGIAREFASLQGASVTTLSSRNDWLAYQYTMAVYAKTLLKVQPSYAEHLQQHYSQIVEEIYLGECYSHESTQQPPEEMRKKIRALGENENLTFKLGDSASEDAGVRDYHRRGWYAVIRKRRMQGAEKGKESLYIHYGRNLGPREGNDSEYPYYYRLSPAEMPSRKYPDGVVHSGDVCPMLDKNGNLYWQEIFMEHAPAHWELGALDAFLATVKKGSDILSRELKRLADARVAWLGAESPHGFVAVMRRGTNSSRAFLTRREKAFAESHTAFAIDDEGRKNAVNLYLEGEGATSKLFWEVMAGKVEGEEKTFVEVDTTLAPLIHEFDFYLEYLPGANGRQSHDTPDRQHRETIALQLHDAWDERLYPGMEPTTQKVILADTMAIAANDGLDDATETKQENATAASGELCDEEDNASPHSSPSEGRGQTPDPRSAAPKALKFYIWKEIVEKFPENGLADVVIGTIKSRCLESVKKNYAGMSRDMYMATRFFERRIKYWSLCKALEKTASDPSYVSAFKLGQAISDVFAIRRTRTILSHITKDWGIAHKPCKGLAVFIGKKGVGTFFSFFADMAEAFNLYEKDDYDAAYMTAGTAVVTVLLTIAGVSAFVTVPIAIIGAVIAGYWTNSPDENWLTHSFWGTYYDGAYKSSPYPPFSYKDFFAKLDKKMLAGSITADEAEERDPKAPKTGVKEHGEQQRQWINMMSEPTANYHIYKTSFWWYGQRYLAVHYTVHFFDYLQSSIVPHVTLVNCRGKKEVLALSNEPTDLMPTPFRLEFETGQPGEGGKATPPKGPDADGKSDLTELMQTVSLNGIFSIDALLTRANDPNNDLYEHVNPSFSLLCDMTFKYLPEMAGYKLKRPLHIDIYEKGYAERMTYLRRDDRALYD